MRHRFAVVFLSIVCAAVVLTTNLASAGAAGETRYARTGPTATSQTTAITLAAARSEVTLLSRPLLTGRVTPPPGEAVEIWQKVFNEPWKLMWPVRTASDGTFLTKPMVTINTAYQARLPGAPSTTSNVVKIGTWLGLGMSHVDGSQFRVGAQAGSLSFLLNGRFALIQKLRSGRWDTLRRVTFRQASSPAYWTVTFRLSLPRGTNRLRAFLPRSQVASAYLPTASKAVIVKR